MNNATSIVLRSAGHCLRPSPWPRPAQLFRTFRELAPSRWNKCHLQSIASQLSSARTLFLAHCDRQTRNFSTRPSSHFTNSPVVQKLAAYNAKKEKGLSFRNDDLHPEELVEVFGEILPPPRQANRFLKVLHGRRLDGTLDIELDKDLQNMMQKYPYALESALYWLRENYAVDEEEAIMQRIEREEANREQENPSELTERAQNLGLYDRRQSAQEQDYYGPQSGHYQARLSDEEGDVFGRSQLERIKAENEAEAAEEERKLQEQINVIKEREEAKAKEKSKAVAARPEQGIEESSGERHEPNEFEKWIMRSKMRATSNLTMESPEIQKLTTAQRLWPSFIFVLLGTVGCYLFSQYWYPPRQDDRLWPSASLSFATVGALVAINTAVFCLWRFPPALRMLNRYFIVVPAYPRAWSMLGNIFSHFHARHFIFNMLGLLIFGPGLHEDVGRGTFLAIYLASGLLGSFASLSSHVFRGMFYTSSQGASGSIWGIAAAYFTIHGDRDFSFVFIPTKMQDDFAVKGWLLLVFLVITDVVVGMRQRNIDVWAHWLGMATGVLVGGSWRMDRREENVAGNSPVKSKSLTILQEQEQGHEKKEKRKRGELPNEWTQK